MAFKKFSPADRLQMLEEERQKAAADEALLAQRLALVARLSERSSEFDEYERKFIERMQAMSARYNWNGPAGELLLLSDAQASLLARLEAKIAPRTLGMDG